MAGEMGRRRGHSITAGFYQRRLHSRSNGGIIRELFGGLADEEFVRRFAEDKETVYRDLYAPHVIVCAGADAGAVETFRALAERGGA